MAFDTDPIKMINRVPDASFSRFSWPAMRDDLRVLGAEFVFRQLIERLRGRRVKRDGFACDV
jgi:hypothetical protein